MAKKKQVFEKSKYCKTGTFEKRDRDIKFLPKIVGAVICKYIIVSYLSVLLALLVSIKFGISICDHSKKICFFLFTTSTCQFFNNTHHLDFNLILNQALVNARSR